MQRTIRFHLYPTSEQQSVLLETMQQYTDCFNWVAAHGWEKQICNTIDLHKATYYPLRAQYPQLCSQLVISARMRAAAAVRSALTWKQKRESQYAKIVSQAKMKGKPIPKFRPMHCPHSNLMPIRYDARSYTFFKNCVSVATVHGRQTLELHLYPHAVRLLGQTVSFDSADLLYRRGRFWLHVVVTLPDVKFIHNGEIIGVDFGITRPAVTSNNRFLGNTCWKQIERKHFRLKRALQSKGTKSAKRHLKKLSGRTARFRIDCDHVVSKQLIQSVVPGTFIVIENLMEIRSNSKRNGPQQRRAMHQWSFSRLRSLLAYKAEACGCAVVSVDPHHTSQTCSRCGFVHRSNRRSRSSFKCQQCGFELHADLNASRNLAQRHLANLGKAEAGGLLSTSL